MANRPLSSGHFLLSVGFRGAFSFFTFFGQAKKVKKKLPFPNPNRKPAAGELYKARQEDFIKALL
ncbi:MAG: hypothetical protein ACRCYO_14135 [Bacteroidia bacterium]